MERVIIIGGGGTGAALAHDLALRGFKVTLFEKGELLSGATGRHHGLLHSGARYAVHDPVAAKRCIQENRTLRKIAPEALELRAWYALNLARDGDIDDGHEVAEDLLERAPEDPWAWYAMAGTVQRHRERYEEAVEASEKALALNPDHPDFLSVRADAIRTGEGGEECIAWIDNLPPEQGQHPLVLIRKAVAVHGLSSEKPEMEEEAFALFRHVMERDPAMVEAPFFLGSRLQSANSTTGGGFRPGGTSRLRRSRPWWSRGSKP